MFTLGVIIARAGSLGLRSKHLLPLMGRPLLQYTLDYMKTTRRLTKVIVSSDCPNILALAGANGFATLERPPELATADASVQDALLHAMDHVESNQNVHVDAVATLYGNVPIRRAGIVDEAVAMLERTHCDSVRSFCPVGKWHPAWMSSIDDDKAIPHRAGSIHRRQDLEPLFLHDGAILVSSRGAMEAGRANRKDPHAFFGVDRRAVLTENTDTVEVDTRRDLLLAEAILREQMGEGQYREARVA